MSLAKKTESNKKRRTTVERVERQLASSDPANQDFTIQHFIRGENSQKIIKPSLGRFDLAKSVMPVNFVESALGQIRKVPRLFWPLLAMTVPSAAFALAPPGFEQFDPVYQ